MTPFHRLLAVLVAAIWGVNFLAIHASLEQFPPFFLAALRWTLIAMQQGARAEAGEYPICELEEAAARVPELMHDVMRMTRHPSGMPAGNIGRWS